MNSGSAGPACGPFVWRDAGRLVAFRDGALRDASQLLAEHGVESFELLSTPRAIAVAASPREPAASLPEAATAVHEVPPGQVPDVAMALLDRTRSNCLVALGGGRVIDTAKAIASVTGARVAAIPTTMSGAEMTGIHRLPAGAEDRVGEMARPAIVIADPDLITSQPEPQLRASSMNALAHGADSLYTPFANPVSRMAALRGAELIAAALDQPPAQRDRSCLALGSILCGYAIDSGLFALHHVVCQTLVRICGGSHADTNAAILPRAMALMVPRAPTVLASLAAAIGCDPAGIETRILELGGHPAGLGAAGADRSKLDQALDAMLLRPELAFTPEPPTRDELSRLIEASW